jgi:CHC2 zinc finger
MEQVKSSHAGFADRPVRLCMPNLAAIVEVLGARKSGNGYVAKCPAHADKTPSLRISERYDKILVHCFAGCDQAAVIAKLRELSVWEPAREYSPAELLRQAQRRAEQRIRQEALCEECEKLDAIQAWALEAEKWAIYTFVARERWLVRQQIPDDVWHAWHVPIARLEVHETA